MISQPIRTHKVRGPARNIKPAFLTTAKVGGPISSFRSPRLPVPSDVILVSTKIFAKESELLNENLEKKIKDFKKAYESRLYDVLIEVLQDLNKDVNDLNMRLTKTFDQIYKIS